MLAKVAVGWLTKIDWKTLVSQEMFLYNLDNAQITVLPK